MNVPMWIAVPVIATTVSAAVTDVRSRRIPNLLTAPALLGGLFVHSLGRGTTGISDSLLGVAIAGGILLPGWLLGWMGAGDVKLMAAVGAWLGFSQGMCASLLALMAGGIIAFVVAVRCGVLTRALWGAAMLGSWAASQGGSTEPPPVTTGIRFPFAVAALTGSVVALWVRI